MRSSRAWVRLSSILVPAEDRPEWVEEWDAELAANGSRFQHALGALPDAWYLRTEGWTMEGMLRDLRMAVRTMVRKPFFTALAGITLAIGIGANSAIYSVVDGVLLDPLPYPESDRLVSANHVATGLNLPMVPHSEAMYLFYQEHFRSLEAFAVFAEGPVNLVADADPQRIRSVRVTESFFDVLGVHPFLGRGFAPGEDRAGAEPVAVLGYGLWQQGYGEDREIVGRVVEMDGVQRRIIGVMPEGFEFPEEAELWMPLEVNETDPGVGNLGLLGLGRLAPGATLAGAQAEMQELLFQIADAYPVELGREVLEEAGLAPDVKPLKDLYTQDVEQALWVLLGTVGFVLLIACANVANLLLTHAAGRDREVALRGALGARRSRIVRQFLTEATIVALAGGLLGLVLAVFGIRGLISIMPPDFPRVHEIGLSPGSWPTRPP
jgi:predicted permease